MKVSIPEGRGLRSKCSTHHFCSLFSWQEPNYTHAQCFTLSSFESKARGKRCCVRKCNAEEQKWGKMDHSKEEVKANLRGHYWAGEHLVSGYHGIIFWGGHEKYWRRIYFYFLLVMFGGIKSPEVLNWASFPPSFFSFQLSIHPSIHPFNTVLQCSFYEFGSVNTVV